MHSTLLVHAERDAFVVGCVETFSLFDIWEEKSDFVNNEFWSCEMTLQSLNNFDLELFLLFGQIFWKKKIKEQKCEHLRHNRYLFEWFFEKVVLVFQLFNDTTCLVVVVVLLGDDDAVKAVRLLGRRYPSFAWLLMLSPRTTAPVDRVECLVVLRVQEAIVGQQRLAALSTNEIEFLVFQNDVDGVPRQPVVLDLVDCGK